MPKLVDHEVRRREIIDAARRAADVHGLAGVTFREVAAEAGVSVALIQHYFGTKANLMAGMLEACAAEMGQRALQRVADLGHGHGALDRVGCIAVAFLPTDEASSSAMRLYLSFAAAALTDATLQGTQAFDDEAKLRELVRLELVEAHRAGVLVGDVDPALEARAIISIVMGLALAVLLGSSGADEATQTIEMHLAAIRSAV